MLLTIYAGPKEFSCQLVDGWDMSGPYVHVVDGVPVTTSSHKHNVFL